MATFNFSCGSSLTLALNAQRPEKSGLDCAAAARAIGDASVANASDGQAPAANAKPIKSTLA
jgi:hypothetical protein